MADDSPKLGMVNDIGKLVLLAVGLVGGFVVVVVGAVTHDSATLTTGVAIVGPVIGYMTGNGVLAARGQAPSPVLVPTPEKIAEVHVKREDDAADAAEAARPRIDL